jgi:hypothetical protein
MKHFRASLVTAVLLGSVSGCSSAKLYQSKVDPLALQQMQTQEFETSKKILFAATISVFQDTGFTIEAADLESGVITAKSATTTVAAGFGASGAPTNSVCIKATAFIEQTRPKFAKVRLNYIESRGWQGNGSGGTNEIPNELPAHYELVFNKIREGVFIREANKATDPVK